MIGAVAPDESESPTMLCAITVNVYVPPFASPITVHWVATPPPLQCLLPGEEETTYLVIGCPPSLTGAVQVTVAA